MTDSSGDEVETTAVAGVDTDAPGPGYAEARHAVADQARLAAVRATALLDTDSEEVFDRLTRLAVRLVGVPAAFLSLVDEHRDFYKSACGFGEPLATSRELSGPTFCHYAIRSAAPLVIPDTAADPMYRDVPTVRSLGVAAYVGIPLVVHGQPVGSFCAIDTRPRAWTADELEVLSELAVSAQREVELRVALRSAESGNARATGVLEEMADAYFALDSEFRIVAVNAAMTRNVGQSREALVGRSMWEAFPGTVGNAFEQSYRRAAEEGRASHFTHDYSDGRLELVTEVDVYPAEGGRVAVFWRDVTERLRTEAALRDSEARFRVMAGAVPQIVWITDAEGRTEFFNEQWTAYTGVAFEPSTAAAVAASFVHPDDGALTMRAFDHARLEGTVFSVEHRIRSASGDYRWFLVRAQPYRDPQSGEIVRWFGVSVDIHDRKLAEAERAGLLAEVQGTNTELLRLTSLAQDATHRARFLADLGQALQPVAQPDAVMETTARMLGEHLGVDRCAYAEVEDDEDTFTITGNYTRGDTASIVGRFTFRAFGAEVLRLMRANTAYVVHDDQADARVEPADRAAYEATQIRAVVCVPLHKSGRFVAAMAVHQRVPRTWTPDEVELVVTVVQRCWEALERARTLRRLRESEAALRATSEQLVERTAAAEAAQQAAEEANRAKTAFLSAMSHELRTPLNAIGGYAELLALGLRGPVNEAQRTDLGRLLRANQHMGGLVTTVLDFARVEAGQVEYHVESVPLGPVLHDLEALVGPQFSAKGLDYDHNGCGSATPDLPHVVQADPEKLRQILLNLLTNAVKFTDAAGRVSLVCDEDAVTGL
ncbi:MAG TPA: GAF domain-containing protein, partial [Gemmatimonas sp.]|nr:GAF domain-containing protein [Gemmatimonas sp.]